jgi:hypothetical protein
LSQFRVTVERSENLVAEAGENSGTHSKGNIVVGSHYKAMARGD